MNRLQPLPIKSSDQNGKPSKKPPPDSKRNLWQCFNDYVAEETIERRRGTLERARQLYFKIEDGLESVTCPELTKTWQTALSDLGHSIDSLKVGACDNAIKENAKATLLTHKVNKLEKSAPF